MEERITARRARQIAAVSGIILCWALPAAIGANSLGKGLICPAASGPEAAWAGNLEVVGAPDLIALLNHLRGTAVLAAPSPGEADPPGLGPNLAQVTPHSRTEDCRRG